MKNWLKEKQTIYFADIVVFWIFVSLVLGMLEAAVLKSGWPLQYVSQIGIGVTFMLYPKAPVALEIRWGMEKSRRFIRLVAFVTLAMVFFNFWQMG